VLSFNNNLKENWTTQLENISTKLNPIIPSLQI